MPSSDEIKARLNLSNAFLAGQKIFGIKFRHNSRVSFENHDGVPVEGWIVSVGPIQPEPIYTVERSDGRGDEEVIESRIKLLHDPHEPSQADKQVQASR